MSEIHKTAASLRFFGANVDPDEITALLGHPPTVGARANGLWHTHNGTPKTARRGFWRREVERVSPGDLDGQIDQLLAPLSGDLSVWLRLSSDFDADIYCGLFMQEECEGLGLSPRTLSRLGERGLVLNLEIYGPGLAD